MSRRGRRQFPVSITACCVSPGGETQSDARGARPPHLHFGVMRTRIQGSGSRARTHAGDKQAPCVHAHKGVRLPLEFPPKRVSGEDPHFSNPKEKQN